MINSIQDLVIFLHNFHSSLNVHPGLSAASIPDNLPDGLIALYREFGSLIGIPSGPFSTQDYLIPVHELEYEDDLVTFLTENQGNWTCHCELGIADPPVYSDSVFLWDDTGDLDDSDELQVICPSLNHFLTSFCLQEAVFSSPFVWCFKEETIDEVLAVETEPLWINGQYVFEDKSHNFYQIPGQDVLFMRLTYGGLWAASHSEKIKQFLKPNVIYQRSN